MTNKLGLPVNQVPSLDQNINTVRPATTVRVVEPLSSSATIPGRFADRARAQIAAEKDQELVRKLTMGLKKNTTTKTVSKTASQTNVIRTTPKYINAPQLMRTFFDRLISFLAELLYFIREFLLSGPRFLWRLMRGTHKVTKEAEETGTKEKSKKKPERVNRIKFG